MIQIESKNVSLCDWSFFLAVDNLGFFNELFISECVAVSERSHECMCVCVFIYFYVLFEMKTKTASVVRRHTNTHGEAQQERAQRKGKL